MTRKNFLRESNWKTKLGKLMKNSDSEYRTAKIINFGFWTLFTVSSIVKLNVFGLVLGGVGFGFLWAVSEHFWFKDQIPPKWWPNDALYEPPTKDEYDLNF